MALSRYDIHGSDENGTEWKESPCGVCVWMTPKENVEKKNCRDDDSCFVRGAGGRLCAVRICNLSNITILDGLQCSTLYETARQESVNAKSINAGDITQVYRYIISFRKKKKGYRYTGNGNGRSFLVLTVVQSAVL